MRLKERHQFLLRPGRPPGHARTARPRHAIVPDLGRHSIDQSPDRRAVVNQGRDDGLAALEDQLELIVFDSVAYPSRPDVLRDVVHVAELLPGEFLPQRGIDAFDVERLREPPAHVRAEHGDDATRYQHEEPEDERPVACGRILRAEGEGNEAEGEEGPRHAEQKRVGEDSTYARTEERPHLHAASNVLLRPISDQPVVVPARAHPNNLLLRQPPAGGLQLFVGALPQRPFSAPVRSPASQALDIPLYLLGWPDGGHVGGCRRQI